MRDRYTELVERQQGIKSEMDRLSRENGEVWEDLFAMREDVVHKQHGRCAYCQVRLLTESSNYSDGDISFDGFPESEVGTKYQIRLAVPKSRGGFEIEENLVACCVQCGQHKASKTHDEFKHEIQNQRWIEQRTAERLNLLAHKSESI